MHWKARINSALVKSKYGLYVAGSLLLAAYKYLPQTVLKDTAVDNLTLKRDGKKVQFDTRLSELLTQARNDLNFLDSCQPQGFITVSQCVACLGFPWSPFGVSVGIPEYFKVFTVEEARSFHLQGLKNDLETEVILSVKETLLISEKAKLYAIARELAQTRNLNPFLQVFYVYFFLSKTIAQALRLEKQFLLGKTVTFRMLCFSTVGLLGIQLYRVVSGLTAFAFDMLAEEEVYQLGKSYVEGAREYNEKAMLRYSQLRPLLESNAFISENGDFNNSWRRLTFSMRLHHNQHYVERYKLKPGVYRLK